MATTIIKVLEQYEIQDKVSDLLLFFQNLKAKMTQIGWATSDNASANDKAMQSLDRKLNKDRVFLKGWAARDHRVR